MARNWRPGTPWVPGVVVEKLGPLSYLIQVETEQLWKRHMDHLRVLRDTPVALEQSRAPDSDWFVPMTTEPSPQHIPERSENSTERTPSSGETSTNDRRYPERERRPLNRLVV